MEKKKKILYGKQKTYFSSLILMENYQRKSVYF